MLCVIIFRTLCCVYIYLLCLHGQYRWHIMLCVIINYWTLVNPRDKIKIIQLDRLYEWKAEAHTVGSSN
jgi:hypothetical protein